MTAKNRNAFRPTLHALDERTMLSAAPTTIPITIQHAVVSQPAPAPAVLNPIGEFLGGVGEQLRGHADTLVKAVIDPVGSLAKAHEGIGEVLKDPVGAAVKAWDEFVGHGPDVAIGAAGGAVGALAAGSDVGETGGPGSDAGRSGGTAKSDQSRDTWPWVQTVTMYVGNGQWATGNLYVEEWAPATASRATEGGDGGDPAGGADAKSGGMSLSEGIDTPGIGPFRWETENLPGDLAAFGGAFVEKGGKATADLINNTITDPLKVATDALSGAWGITQTAGAGVLYFPAMGYAQTGLPGSDLAQNLKTNLDRDFFSGSEQYRLQQQLESEYMRRLGNGDRDGATAMIGGVTGETVVPALTTEKLIAFGTAGKSGSAVKSVPKTPAIEPTALPKPPKSPITSKGNAPGTPAVQKPNTSAASAPKAPQQQPAGPKATQTGGDGSGKPSGGTNAAQPTAQRTATSTTAHPPASSRLTPKMQQVLDNIRLPIRSDADLSFVPPKKWRGNEPLPKGNKGGFLDAEGNEWVRGRATRTDQMEGVNHEWDVIPANPAKHKGVVRNGHINVSQEGKITH